MTILDTTKHLDKLIWKTIRFVPNLVIVTGRLSDSVADSEYYQGANITKLATR